MAICPEALNVSRAADDLLSSGEVVALRAHISACPQCVRWARSLRLQRLAFQALRTNPWRACSSGSLSHVSIFNRRNAALGWLTWMLGKRVAEVKARSVVSGDEGRSKKKLFVGALAAVGAVLFFWRRRDEDEQPPSAA